MALCITTEYRFQRRCRSAESVMDTMSLPSNRTSPEATWAGGVSSRAIAYRSVDLPHPDSPTMPRNSPLHTSSDTRSTARTGPRSVR